MHVIPKHRSGVTHHDSITLRHHVRRQLGEAVGFYRVHREVAQRARVGVVGVDEGVAGGDEKVGEGEEAVQVGGVGWGEAPGGGREGRVEGEGVGIELASRNPIFRSFFFPPRGGAGFLSARLWRFCPIS